ncbi:hypothetical protein B0J13DRAFT_640475 [Dactylonectria estremocensis]|uniref:Uncharacterized protein n=1 Tax=Dactylonectria estremocensis TaxID=1079267 RepID=A0A9P9EHS2_9HYPO|nr:hypothetical protein B0J13DRAFT_640475 [Dactylonectria estremocensis]
MPAQVEVHDLQEDWTNLKLGRKESGCKIASIRAQRPIAPKSPRSSSHTTQLVQSTETREGMTPKSQALSAEAHELQLDTERRERISNFAQTAYENYKRCTPRPTHLFALIWFDVVDAITRNAALFGSKLSWLCADELISPFDPHGPDLPASTPEKSYLHSLRPSELQVSTVHHPWSDLLAIPALRDNPLRAIQAGFDEDYLCVDIMRVDENYARRELVRLHGVSRDGRRASHF